MSNDLIINEKKSNGDHRNDVNKNDNDNDIFDSIAAVRSFLMLDTPTRSLVAVGHKQQQQRQPFFSSYSTTPTKDLTPARNSPSVKTVRTLGTSHADLKKDLDEETDRRKSLEATYKQLHEFRTKQTSQLEVISSSRDSYRNETIKMKNMLETERKQHSATITALKSAAEALVPVVESQRSEEIKKLRHEIETLKTKIHKKDERYTTSESLVKSLTKEVETLNADLKLCRQNYELTLHTTIKKQAKETESLRARIESEWVEQTKKLQENEQTALNQLKDVKHYLSKLKVQYSSEKEKMGSEKAELESSLKEAIEAQEELEHELEDITGELTRMHERVKETHVARNESEKELQKLIAELDAVKYQLGTDRKLQSEKDDLEQRLCVAEKDHKKSDTPKTHLDLHQELKLEKEELERRLRDAKENCVAFEKELHETNMELGGLKQNLEEAEQIEQQNEVLVNRLGAMSEEIANTENLKENLKAVAHKDTLLRNVQLELEDARAQLSRREDKAGAEVKLSRKLEEKEETVINLRSELESVREDLLKSEDMVTKKDAELSNVIDDNNNNNTVIVENLRKELMASKTKFAILEERLNSSNLSDLTSLIDVATSREKARFLKDDLDELEEKINGDHQVIDVDRKRDSEVVKDSPRKRVKTRDDDDDDDDDSDSDSDDAIVL